MVISHNTQSRLQMDPLLNKWEFYEDLTLSLFTGEKHIISTRGWKPYHLLTHLFHIPLIFIVFDVLFHIQSILVVLGNPASFMLDVI